ncbi:MAG TPA: hypothetical protein DIW53_15435 [Achromobacter sp.]|nr:hypothetical protein [Achromobacter sp.]
MLANNVSSGGGAVNLTGNSISAGQVSAGSGNVTLTARAGNITGTSASLITGNVVTLLAPASNSSYTVGTTGTYLRTAAGELHATGGSIYINQAQGSVLLDDLKAYNGISVIGVADLTANKVDAGLGTLWLNAQGGNILRANANSELLGNAINLQAQQHIGTAGDHIKTATTSLTLGSGGDIYVDNPGKTLNYLAVSNTHADPLRKNVLQVSAPFLAFDVNDDVGNAYELKQVYSSLLNQFVFSGDQTLKLGNIRAGSGVTLTSTQGSILDDGIADTRVTASSVSLTAAQDIGTNADFVSVNAPLLSLDTRGNLYATNIADLNSLTVTARHKGPDDHYVLDVRAPSLLFNITDDATGHTIHQVRDSNSVTFNFASDRDITVGSIDAGYSGAITLNTTGSIADDGNKNTQLLANLVSLSAGRAIGATGTGYLDILTSNLYGSAGNGGFYVQLPKPTGSSNTTGLITLNNITATDAVRIDARQGDLLVSGTVRSANGDVTINAANGSILGNGSGNVYAGGGDISLTATGSIGGNYGGGVRYVGVGGPSQVNVLANAGGDLYLNGTYGNIKLASVTAGGQLGYTQGNGTTLIGNVQAAGPASLANSAGSILDDGDAATKIQASSIALSAAGSLGAAGAALTLQAPDVSLTSGGDITVNNETGLTRLAVTRNGYVYGSYAITAPNLSAFTLTDDANGIHLKDIASSTDLDFGFSANGKNLWVGNIDAGAGGKVSLIAGGNIANDDLANPGTIRAANVALTAGASSSIGSSATGGTLALAGTSALSLSAGIDFFVASDTVLRSLAINSQRASGATSTIAIGGGAGQTIRITDDGTTQYLEQITGGLTDFSFSGRKNIQVGAITASNLVSLTTAYGGVNSSITSDAGSGRITAGTVKLSATGSDSYTARDANTGAIGAAGRALRTTTANLAITNNGDIFLNNGNQALSSIDLNLSRRDAGSTTNFDTNAYAFGGLGGQTLSIAGGTSLTIAADMNGAALAVNADSAIATGTINTGAAGSVTLTSRYANTSFLPTISRGSGVITGNNVSLNALGTNGSVAASTSTNNLSIASAGNVSVSNDKQLTSLSLTANHASSSGSQNNSYSVSATGLTFSLSDSTGTSGLTLGNVSTAGNLALSISSDRALTVNNVATGAGGSVTLGSNSNIYGNSSSASSPNITTGALTLNASSVTGTYNTNQPLYVSVDKLSSNLRGSLWISNNKTLTLGNNNVAGSAQVNVTNGSILQGAGSSFVAPSLTLTATQSIGAAGNAVQADTRQLTTQTGKDLYLNNASNLFSLNVTANHANPSVDNVVQVAAQGLTFNVTDTGGYNLFDVRDTTGLNFSFSGDRTVYIGNIDTGPAHAVSLAANGAGSNLLNLSPTSHVTGDSVSLFATGQIGSGPADKINTTTSELYLTSGSHVYVNNDVDLASLSLYATGVAPSTYDVTSNELLFDVVHDGRLQVNNVRDNTGLNLMLSSNVGQDIGIIDTQSTGTVRLSSNNSILGSADDSQRITAAQVSLTTQGSGAIGGTGREINLSAPLLNIQNAGDVYIDSNQHIDALSLYSTGNGARSYSINSPTRDGQGNIGFTATDGGSGSTAGLVLGNITDAGGLNLTVSSDRNVTVGTINVGYDNVSLTSRNASLLGDGDANTKIDAASLNLTANAAIGASGVGNAIDTRVSTLSGRAVGGGAFITVEGNTSLPSLTSTGASSVSNTVGDIELGSVNTNGNSFTVNNSGGSILSGTISNATTVTLTANGSIGNKSAIRTTNLSSGGTTIVNLSANQTATADGSIALIETYGLQAASVTGDGNITLTADTARGGRDLVVGTISTSNGAVALSTSTGNIVGANNSNRITGNSVTLTADYGTSRSIGSGNANRIHLDTPSLTLNTPGSIYVDNLADLSDLTINRNNAQGNQYGSNGFLTIDAQNLTFSGADTSNNTALTIVRDTTGLNFTYQAIGSITLNDIDVTANGSVNLSTNPYYYTGGSIQGMTGTSKITAGNLTLSTGSGDTPNAIGSSTRALNTQVKNIAATASGGIWLNQAGSINLGNLNAGEDLSVTTTTGDILVGSVRYGSNKTLTLNAQNGSILDGGGAISGSGTGAITLTAKNGIGTTDAAIKIAALNNAVSASVTGAGSLYLDSVGSMQGGLSTSVANGETRITSSGSLFLTSMTSGTDAAGNGISVKATAGSIFVKNVQAGATQGQVTLNAENGAVLADVGGANIKAYGVALNARSGIGVDTANGRINASGQRVEATTLGGMYLAADNNAVYSYLSGGIIDIAAAGNLQIANAVASNGSGTIKIVGNGTNSQLVAGNIDAGTVNIDYSKTGSTIVDDREESTRIIGNSVTLKAGAGIGGAEGSADNVQTTAAFINAEVTGNGSIFLDDNRAAGTTLNAIATQNGAIGITTAGPTLVNSAVTKTNSATNDISIATSNGDLSINTIDALALGDVTLKAAGSILGAIPGNLVFGNSLTATAGGSIGTVGNLATGLGGIALRTNVASLGDLTTGADGAVIALNNVGTRALTLNGDVTQTGDNSSVYLRSSGDLDARSGLSNTADNVLLSSNGTLTVAGTGVQANDTITLVGLQDVVAADATPRNIIARGDTLNVTSGAAGGNTALTTEVANANVNLTGATTPANLTLNNTGALTASLSTANGNITANATGTLDVSATAAGNNRGIDLSSQHGDVVVGTINAGAANGTVVLAAAEGSLVALGSSVTTNSLDLTSKNGIGDSNAAFTTSARYLKANVLGAGDIVVEATGPLTLGNIATADGSIQIAADGDLISSVGLTAGNHGDVLIGSSSGNVGINHAITNNQVNNLTVIATQIGTAAVDTAGAQAYNGSVTLGGDLTGASIDISGNATLTGGKRTLTANGDGGNVNISGALNGGNQQAVIVANDGNVTLGGNAINLAGLSIDGANISLQNVATSGAQQYNGDTTLRGLYTTGNGAFGVDGDTVLAGGVNVYTGNGAVTFTGDVSGANALTVLTAGATTYGGAVNTASLNQVGTGVTALNGGSVTTTGMQSYSAAVVLGADTTLSGSGVTLADGVDGAYALTVDGPATLAGAIGANTKLASLTVNGPATLTTGSIATTGSQHYQNDVTLGSDQSLSTTTGNVTFDGALIGGRNVVIDSTAAGDISFNAVGSAGQRLGNLTANTAGATTFNGAVYAASAQTDAPGTVAINGGLVDTTGTQTFRERVTLGADTVLKGSSVNLLGGGNGPHDLTIDGDAVFKGAFGAQDALASLTVNGTSSLDGSIGTTGKQSYNGEVTLDGDVALTTQGGSITFNDKVASSQGDGHDLALSAGAGNVTFTDAVGDDAGGRLGDITIASQGATALNGAVYAASVTSDVGGTIGINGGLVDTTGAQSYGERVVLGGDTVLKGSTVGLLGGADGSHELTIDGDAVLKGPIGAQNALAGLTVNGKSTLGQGRIATTGDQSYQGAVTLGGDVTVASRDGDIRFNDAVDGGHDMTASADKGNVEFAGPVGQGSRLGNLTINASGDTVLDGPVRTASLQTSGNGDLLINGGSVDTTGSQQYGQHVILSGVDTTLTGTNVQLKAGVDGTESGQQGLIIAGNADIQGDIGATTPLRGLAIEGTTTMGPGKVVTTGDQVYTGAVTLTGDRDLTSTTGSVVLGSKLDGNGNNLAINAGKNVQVAGDATGLGSLTLRAVDTIVFNGDVSAYRVQQLEAKSASYNGNVRASGPDGIDIKGGKVAFGKDVTADTGSIRITNTDPTGTTTFAAGSTVKAATGFTQTGGAGLTLPTQLLVTQGPINLGAPATLQGANATISTNGDITAVGLMGPQTALTLAAGPLGALRIGLNDADLSHKLNVASLTVPTAGSADVWGTVGGKTGAVAAASIKSSLVGSPYYLNGTTWGPTGVIDRLSAITAPQPVIPTTPTASSLFRGTVPSDSFGPDPLGAYADPQVLKVASATFNWQLPSGDNAMLNVPNGNTSVLQAPAANPQQPVAEGSPSSDDERRDNDAQSRTL